MHIRRPSRINLRQLILVLSIFSMLVMLVAGLAGTYQAQRQQLIDEVLSTNEVFAAKLAATASDLLRQAQHGMAYSADIIEKSGMTPAVLQAEVERLRQQGIGFNVVSITDEHGVLQVVSPGALRFLKGHRVDTDEPLSVSRHQVPAISKPFITVLGDLAVLMTHPLYAPDMRYLGYIAGALYLKTDGGVSRLFGQQYFHDETYVYVVDSSRRLIYHPQPDRIGQSILGNPVIDAVLQGRSGRQRLVNSQGIDMLAGYAHVPVADWGVVVQRPTSVALRPVDDLMWRVSWRVLVPAMALLVLLWLLSRWISRPLRQLALIVRDGYGEGLAQRIGQVSCWYFEAQQLKRALLLGAGAVRSQFGLLLDAAHTDPLTGLGNRRALDVALRTSRTLGRSFAVMVLDIDFFKRINDHYGHDVGDRVIRRVGELMRGHARQGDSLFRMGGEEFLILLPGMGLEVAVSVAERLRASVEQASILPEGAVTVSIGVAAWTRGDMDAVLKAADQALYRAKEAGRNRVARDGEFGESGRLPRGEI
ncbi:MAG: sensor domain-containing diguanylate cyclase [Castellaniella sp.]|nr:sensor domain-containing diguanylate cyclase [Castellaniella sp.]